MLTHYLGFSQQQNQSLVGSKADVVQLNIRPKRRKLHEEWWAHTSVYQIYPRSFQDSNSDGTGDLKGNINKSSKLIVQSSLKYVLKVSNQDWIILLTWGIETLWLSPIFKSPMKDFGYDISDFMSIDPIFGSLQDFIDLTAAAHSKGTVWLWNSETFF